MWCFKNNKINWQDCIYSPGEIQVCTQAMNVHYESEFGSALDLRRQKKLNAQKNEEITFYPLKLFATCPTPTYNEAACYLLFP